MSITPAALERARAANRRRKARLFGVGEAGLFRIGPNPELLGRSLADLAVQPGELTTSGFVSSFEFDASSRHAPVWFTGRLVGADPEARRELALAVNGRVAAVGRTVRLRGSPEERFSLLVPEAELRPGPNDAALFEVQDGRLLRLEPTTRASRAACYRDRGRKPLGLPCGRRTP